MPLDHFISETLKRRLIVDPDRDELPGADDLTVALFFADISGFTALMERQVQRGPSGLEDLTQILNAYFGRIIALIGQHGGDVLGFAGDALFVVWSAEHHADGLTGACRRAAQCALEVQALECEPEAQVLMRIAVCAGETKLLRVGDSDRRFTVLIGHPVAQIATTLKAAQPGATAFSQEVRAVLGGVLQIGRGRARILPPDGLDEPGRDTAITPVDVPPEYTTMLRRYVPEVIRETMTASGEIVAQFRQVSVMFARLPVPDPTAPTWLAAYQGLLTEIQGVIRKFGGHIDKVISEDKGVLLLAVWGLPGATHEDAPLRTVRAAVRLRELLVRGESPVAIGVATGRAYCGLIGSELRSEYTIMGTVVNRAARIMQLADGILCDEVTRSAAEERVEFADGKLVAIRGMLAKITVSEPRLVLRDRREHSKALLLGRHRELAEIQRCLHELVEQRRGRSIIISGKPGIGKTRLLDRLQQIAVLRGVLVFKATGDAVDIDAPYAAIRPIVAMLLAQPTVTSEASMTAGERFSASASDPGHARPALAALADDAELAERAPLLEAILPCGLVETEFTRALAPEARAGLLAALIATLVRRQTSRHPVLVVLDDVQWFDTASLSLLRALTKTVGEALFTFAIRPQTDGGHPEVAELRREAETVSLDLEGLDDASKVALTAGCLGIPVEGVPDRLEAVIRDKSEGNPLFIEQLTLTLLDQGHIAVDGGVCSVRTASGELSDTELPSTIEGILHGRVDRLPPRQLAFLKVACVLGRSIDLRIAHAIDPGGPDPKELEEIVDALIEQGILSRPDQRAGLCEFRYSAMRQALYDTLMFTRRRELHRAVAEWYERQNGDPSAHLGVLAHHWSRTADTAKARRYLDLAGTQALAHSANAEAARLLESLLALGADADVPSDAARWRVQLCEAHFLAGNMPASLRSGVAALELLGLPMPSSSLGMLASLARLILERNIEAVPRSFPRDVAIDVHERRLQALKLHHRLTDIYGFLGHVPALFLSSCRELALAEACDRHGTAACAHLMIYFIAVVTPLRRRAAPWIDTALALAAREPDRALVATTLGRVAAARLQAGEVHGLQELVEDASAQALAAGDLRVQAENYMLHAFWSMYRGLFAEGEQHFGQVATATDFSGDEQLGAWSLIGRAACVAEQDRVDEAMLILGRVRPWLEAKATPTTYIWGQGIRAAVTLRAGDREGATVLVHKVLEHLRQAKVLGAYWLLGGIEAICTVALALLADADAAQRRASLRRARACVGFLKRFGETLPFGAAFAAFQQAELARLTGRPAQARALLERCIELAARQDALHLQARACERLAALDGAHLPRSLALREAARVRAHELRGIDHTPRSGQN